MLKAMSSNIYILNLRLSANKQLKGKLNKLKNEVLGSSTVDGSPEPENVSMDSAYDMTG